MQVNTRHAPLVEFMYLAFTHMPGESYHRQLRSLLLSLYLVLTIKRLITVNNPQCDYQFCRSQSQTHTPLILHINAAPFQKANFLLQTNWLALQSLNFTSHSVAGKLLPLCLNAAQGNTEIFGMNAWPAQHHIYTIKAAVSLQCGKLKAWMDSTICIYTDSHVQVSD